MKILYKVTFLLLIGLSLGSCKTLKNKPASKVDIPENSTDIAILSAHENAFFNARTLEAKMDAHYDDGTNNQEITVKLRLEKDKNIWMSANFLGIPMAKILITPDRIRYYEKIHQVYFDGDYQLLEDFLGIEVRFDQIQNLLLGQALFGLKEKMILSQEDNDFVKITPQNQNEQFDIFYFLNPKNYKLASQEAIMANQDSLFVKYSGYQNVDNQWIPTKISLKMQQPAKKTKVNLDIRNVELNNNLSFPFDIPDGYDRLELTRKKQ